MPCPFCNGEAEECYQRDDTDDWKIECQGCGAVSCPDRMRYDKQQAIHDWNTRIIKGMKLTFRSYEFGKMGNVFDAVNDSMMCGPCSKLEDVFDEINDNGDNDG